MEIVTNEIRKCKGCLPLIWARYRFKKGRIICALSQTDPMINLYDALCSHCLCHFLKSGNIGTYHIILLKSIFL